MRKSLEGGFGSRLLGSDDPRTFAGVIGVVGVYWLLDAVTRSAAALAPENRFGWSLAWGAARENPVAIAVAVVGLLFAGMRGRTELMGPWSRLEHGDTLRMIATPLLVLVTWYGALYDYNYVLDQWHAVDRLLVLLFAVGAWYRPVFLVPLVLQGRIVADQFATPLGVTAGRNIGDLLLIALLCLVATYLFTAIAKRSDSSPALLLLSAALAAHFFAPGRAKLGIDWISNNHLGNFALNSYTAGWLGSGDGSWARNLESFADTFRLPILLGTIVVEFGAIIAVLHRRLLRFWLAGWVALHVAIFAMSGFFLFEWVVLEVILFVVMVRRDQREWVATNQTPARALLAAGLVLFGSTFFHPPKLAWIDAPVAYGYEIEAVTTSGERLHVALSAFAPLEENLTLAFAEYRPEPLVVGGYGAADSKWLSDRLRDVATFDDLERLEREYVPVAEATRLASERLIVSWLDHVNRDDFAVSRLLAPPSRYWNSRPSPTYDFGEPLRSVEVILATSILDGSDQKVSRESVLTVIVGEDGRATVAVRGESSGG